VRGLTEERLFGREEETDEGKEMIPFTASMLCAGRGQNPGRNLIIIDPWVSSFINKLLPPSTQLEREREK